MKTLIIALTISTLIVSCSSDTSESNNKEDAQPTKEDTSQSNEDTTETVAIDSAWSYYSAYIGIYDEPAMLELSFNGDDVNGSYWYAKHGKALKLTGKLNPDTQKYEVNETYKGKLTGKMVFTLDKDLTLNADWSNPKGKDKEHFVGTVLDLPNTKKNKPTFASYEMSHQIEAYNSESGEFEIEEAEDLCRVMRVGNTIVFSYSVIGHNYHSGNIDASLELDENGRGTFNGEDGCLMTFELKGDELRIEEVESCSYYKGHRAFFGGLLKKI